MRPKEQTGCSTEVLWKHSGDLPTSTSKNKRAMGKLDFRSRALIFLATLQFYIFYLSKSLNTKVHKGTVLLHAKMPSCTALGTYTTGMIRLEKKKEKNCSYWAAKRKRHEHHFLFAVTKEANIKFPIIYFSFSTFLLQYKTGFEIYKDKNDSFHHEDWRNILCKSDNGEVTEQGMRV